MSQLARASAVLSASYRGHKSTAALDLSAQVKVAAYLAVRLPATYSVAHAVLAELQRRIGGRSVSSILDLGSGPGAATLAARSLFPALPAALVDSDRSFAAVARELLPDALILNQDLLSLQTLPRHDVVVACYSLGELPEAGRRRLIELAWRAARLALVVIEPGSRPGFAVVRAARDLMLAAGAHVVAPCPAGGPCPMPRSDWCHFAARLERTSLLRRMKDGELSYEDEKFSYVIVAKDQFPAAAARIVRRPEHRPGLINLTLCDGGSVVAKRVTRRDRVAFRAARKAAWGDEWQCSAKDPS
jgi:ribosomal protein RSM22 (predicted rRNA methylase)